MIVLHCDRNGWDRARTWCDDCGIVDETFIELLFLNETHNSKLLLLSKRKKKKSNEWHKRIFICFPYIGEMHDMLVGIRECRRRIALIWFNASPCVWFTVLLSSINLWLLLSTSATAAATLRLVHTPVAVVTIDVAFLFSSRCTKS